MKILTKGKLEILIDREDTSLIENFSLSIVSSGYVLCYSKERKTYTYLHRILMNAQPGMDVDHINGNKLDNRKENLRVCTRSQNLRNAVSPKPNRTLPKGVYFVVGKRAKPYQVKFKFENSWISCGCYSSVEAAEAAYKRVIDFWHKQFSFIKSRKV